MRCKIPPRSREQNPTVKQRVKSSNELLATLIGIQASLINGHYEIVPKEANLLTYEQYLDELRKIQSVLEED